MKKIIVLLLVMFLTICGALSCGKKQNNKKDDNNDTPTICQHEGFYYEAKDATTSECGWKEFWICKKCHEIFLNIPAGSFSTGDPSEMEGGIPTPEHPAYIPMKDGVSKYTKTLVQQNDSFKILNLTDVQLHDGDNFDDFKHIVDTLVEREHPDLITLLGDIINDDENYGVETNARKTVELLDSYDIPWAPIFGNHDNLEYRAAGSKKTGGVPFLMGLFAKCKNCLFIEGPSEVQGKSNYMINVVDKEGKMVKSLIFLDSFTNGLQESNATFYKQCVEYAKQLNGGKVVSSVIFTHIPILEYTKAYHNALDNECHNLIGNNGNEPLAAGTAEMFKKMTDLNSTTTIICGHDHESAFITKYSGFNFAYALKSSLGDNKEDNNNTHPLGSLVIEVGNMDDNLYFSKVEDITYELKVGTGLAFHPGVLPYWRFSGAKLVFDVELPTNGHLKFNIQGSNFQRVSAEEKYRKGEWNRLTNNTDLGTDVDGLCDYGTMTKISGNLYHYEADLSNWILNSGEDAYGDETAKIVYFNSVTGGNFKLTNIHWEYEEVSETNQLDLSNAYVAEIPTVSYYGTPVKPNPVVKLGGVTLKEGEDIIYTYTNNDKAGTATLKIIPSGKGAHKYKGHITTTFTVIKGDPIKGEPFKVGADYIKDLSPIKLTSQLYLDVKFTSEAGTYINVFLGDGWDNYFGYYKLLPTTQTNEYNGISVTPIENGYIRFAFNLSELRLVNNSTSNDKSVIKKINLVYIRGGWSNAAGYVDIIEDAGPVDEHRGTLINSASTTISCYHYKVEEGGVLTIDYVYKDITTDASNGVSMYFGTDIEHCFGAVKIYKDRLEKDYNGVTFEKLEDGYNRIMIDFSLFNDVYKEAVAAPLVIEKIMFKWFEASQGVYFDVNPDGTGKNVVLKMTDDDYKIAVFTDIHIQKAADIAEGSDVRKTINYAMSTSAPDAAVFTGDFIHTSNADLLDDLCNFMDSFNIPYFFVFGNHDRENVIATEIAEHVLKSKYGYIDLGPSLLNNGGNYVVKIENANGELVHALIMLDTKNKHDNDPELIEYVTTKVAGVYYGTHDGKSVYCDDGWDGVRGAQIGWYKEQVASLGCDNTVFMHAGMVEYTKAYENYKKALASKNQEAIDACAPIGPCDMKECCCGPCANYGFFAAIKEMGTTKNVICGHDHVNDFSLLYEGVRLTYALKCGDGAYGGASTQSGYTLLTIDNTGKTTINQMFYDYTK